MEIWQRYFFPLKAYIYPRMLSLFGSMWYGDLNGIIEVYDNNTPGKLTDDVIVLARDFWNRFSIIPVISK
jgi:hypothetical protein